MTSRMDIVCPRDSGDKTYFTKIGVAFPNKNGNGYTLVFEALPLPSLRDGKIETRALLMEPRDDRQGGSAKLSRHDDREIDAPF